MLAAADTHEAMLEFIETNFRSTIALDATTSEPNSSATCSGR
ncbi:hypothetical protein [Nocardia sp. NRRL S-836]|nr:hypothetical protein [Nocardia sp. NRRL S-836]